jgi:hypothetical protein
MIFAQDPQNGFKQQDYQAAASPTGLRPSVTDLLKRVSDLEHSSHSLQEVAALQEAVAKMNSSLAAAEKRFQCEQQQVQEDVVAMGLELEQVSILI